jgi:hypothetical protein
LHSHFSKSNLKDFTDEQLSSHPSPVVTEHDSFATTSSGTWSGSFDQSCGKDDSQVAVFVAVIRVEENEFKEYDRHGTTSYVFPRVRANSHKTKRRKANHLIG